MVSIQRTLGKTSIQLATIKTHKDKTNNKTSKVPTGKLKSHYAAIDEDDERKDMESPHDEVTSARAILAIVAE